MAITPRNPEHLVLVAELLRDAERTLGNTPLQVEALRAVLLVDLAVERFLGQVATDADPTGERRPAKLKGNASFHDLWTWALSACKSKGIPVHALAERVRFVEFHTRRNDAQHSGITPDQAVARNFIEQAKSMFRHGFRDVYGLEFDDFRYPQLIRTPAIRLMVEDAETLLSCGDYVACAGVCGWAFDEIVGAISEQLQESEWDGYSRGLPLPRREGRDDDDQYYFKRLTDAVDKKFAQVYRTFAIEHLRLDDQRLSKFRDRPNAYFSINATRTTARLISRGLIDERVAIERVSFLFEAAVAAERRFPGATLRVAHPASIVSLAADADRSLRPDA